MTTTIPDPVTLTRGRTHNSPTAIQGFFTIPAHEEPVTTTIHGTEYSSRELVVEMATTPNEEGIAWSLYVIVGQSWDLVEIWSEQGARSFAEVLWTSEFLGENTYVIENPKPVLPPWLAAMQAMAEQTETDTAERLASDIYRQEGK